MVILRQGMVNVDTIHESSMVSPVIPADFNPETHWTPRAPSDIRKTTMEFRKLIGSGTSQRGWTQSIGVYDLYDFRNNQSGQVQKLHIEYSLIVYGNSTMEAVNNFILDKLGILNKTWEYEITDYTLIVMYKGLKFTVHNYSSKGPAEFNNATDSSSSPYLLGYGGFGELLNILCKPRNYRATMNGFQYELKNPQGGVHKVYTIASSIAALSLFGLKEHGHTGFFNGFQNLNSFISWLMKSRHIGYSSFYIDKNFEYTGPAEYMQVPLFRDIVAKLIEFNSIPSMWEYRATPTVLKETISRIEKSVWGNSGDWNEMEKEKSNMVFGEAIGRRYDSKYIMQLFNVDEKNVREIKIGFERHLSKTMDPEFFLLSSSEETIGDALQEYRDMVPLTISA
jgi:hypothetical protein